MQQKVCSNNAVLMMSGGKPCGLVWNYEHYGITRCDTKITVVLHENL
jgi:hypothetical protein